MRWEDENWVKLYTRDTPTWKAMCWQARALLPLLLRVFDRAGLMECGELGRSAVPLMVGLPEDVALTGLADLERLGSVIWHGNVLEMPKYEEAQEARSSDLVRKREQRQRDKDKARAEARKSVAAPDESKGVDNPKSQPSVTLKDVSHGVTRGHTVSRPDSTDSTDSSDIAGDKVAPPPAPKAPKKEKPTDPRHRPTVAMLTGLGFGFLPRHARSVSELLALGEPEEIERRAKRALARTGFPTVREIHELVTHWGHFATDSPLKATGTDVTKGRVSAESQNWDGVESEVTRGF